MHPKSIIWLISAAFFFRVGFPENKLHYLQLARLDECLPNSVLEFWFYRLCTQDNKAQDTLLHLNAIIGNHCGETNVQVHFWIFMTFSHRAKKNIYITSRLRSHPHIQPQQPLATLRLGTPAVDRGFHKTFHSNLKNKVNHWNIVAKTMLISDKCFGEKKTENYYKKNTSGCTMKHKY